MTVFFTSDPHLGHNKVSRLRGFESTDAHDDAFAEFWISDVGPNDVVYILGDIASASPHYALQRLGELPGRKRLILGNHDKPHPMYRDAHRWQGDYLAIFESIAPAARLRVDGVEVLLSHFPYVRDREGVVRHPQWRLPDLGLPLLHGHTHGTERLTVTGSRVEVHVGLDAWGLSVVPDTEVARLVREGQS